MIKKLFFCLPVLLLMNLLSKGQVTENFADGDFTANPVWTGNTDSFIVNPSFQLQSNAAGVASIKYYLSTPNTLATTAQWEFFVNLKFSVSSANYVDVYLTASAENLTTTTTTGYFVRIGNTAKEINLYRKGAGGSNDTTRIIDGTNGTLSSTSNNIVRIKVTRDAANQWVLYRDLTGGTTYTSEGVATDATYTTSSFFGILIIESSAATPRKNHFFDDILIQPYTPDITAPTIQSSITTSSTTVDVLFSEPLDATSSQLVTNYVANNGLGSPSIALLDGSNTALVHLTFANAFPSGVNCQLTVNGVKDLAGNAISNGTTTFSFTPPHVAAQYDVVIDELIADPTPLVGLPNSEWIELKNTTSSPINLQGWTISDASGTSGPMPNFILEPDSFVVVCTGSAVAALQAFGKVISVTSFPSLDNTGELLSVTSAQGNLIHSVNYNVSWYQNELKKDGGWTLEMIDTHNPCSGSSNWKASTDARGGTPGSKNSVDGINPDQTAPKLIKAYAVDATTITLYFDEPLNSTQAAVAGSYSVSDGIGAAVSAIPVAPGFDRVTLTVGAALLANKVYTVIVTGITDCAGNAIGAKNSARVGLATPADSFDVVINEILFNPPPTGTDYVEIYNRSNKILDLQKISIANRNTAGVISSIAPASATPYLLFPGDFMVLTEDPSIVKASYITLNPDAFSIVGSMPSFNDDKSNVILLNAQGNIMDELAYTDKWHYKLLDNKEGVALERIDYNAPTQSTENWHSAATSVNYGTPTYKNSQYRADQQVQGDIAISPEVFSPDNDGLDDFATLDYNFSEPGYLANITIFDASGRPVRYLQKGALCGIKGSFRWDGLGEKNQRLAVGIYVIYTEVFNLKGKKKQFKNTVVLARRN